MGEHTENGTQSQQTQQVEQRQPPEGRQTALVRFDPETATEAWQLARYYGASKLIPGAAPDGRHLRHHHGGPRFRLVPMQAMRGIHVVEGKPSLSADAMVAIVKSSGQVQVLPPGQERRQGSDLRDAPRGRPGAVRMGFTIAEAEVAGLLATKGPWQTYRKRMLRNRAKSVLCKEVYEDIFFGVYEDDEAHEVEEIRQSKARRSRRRSSRKTTPSRRRRSPRSDRSRRRPRSCRSTMAVPRGEPHRQPHPR
jgi:hypothetical protein